MTDLPPPPGSEDNNRPKRKRAPSVAALKRMLADVSMERDALREQCNVLQKAALASNAYAQAARAAVEDQLAGIAERLDAIHALLVSGGKDKT